jgi:hypothetical protein
MRSINVYLMISQLHFIIREWSWSWSSTSHKCDRDVNYTVETESGAELEFHKVHWNE